MHVVTYGGLAIGVIGVSAAAIFIRLAGDAPAMTVATYRMGISALVVAIPTLTIARGQLGSVTSKDLRWLLLAGLFLAAHFATWITSLELTSVASSVLLVTTTPVFVAIGSHWGLRERVSMTIAAAVALSLAGGVVLAWDQTGDNSRLLGNGLALTGSICAAGYMLVGRKVRSHIPLLPYVTIVYAAAAVVLLVSTVTAGQPLIGFSVETYLWMILVALIPQVIGHTGLNWALAHLNATVVTLSVRAEPIIATLLAIPVLDETPGWAVLPGGALILAGVGVAIRAQLRIGDSAASV
jgi:drug/metabolite transporter (DMT)-like permease